MITRRNFGKLGIRLAAASRISPFLFVSSADAQEQAAVGEGGDIRRVGVRSNGTYWEHGSEMVDLLSGNLCYLLGLVGAKSRNCDAAVCLSYNSQIWKQGLSAAESYGSDSGPGFGWACRLRPSFPR